MKNTRLAAMVCLILWLTGCDLLAVKEQQTRSQAFCPFSGEVDVETPGAGHPVVVLFRHEAGPIQQKAAWQVVDHFALDQPGPWFFLVQPGQYLLTAFVDANHNQVFEPDESVIPIDWDRILTCQAGEAHEGLALRIPAHGRAADPVTLDIAKLQVRSSSEQLNLALGQALQVGKVTTLNDPRFSPELAKQGLWRPYDFFNARRAGLYFLEPFDPARTPVLFVHGVNGSPLDFAYLIRQLDRSRFQPWVFYYPSGAQLQRVGRVLEQLLRQLQAEQDFQRLLIVAHSMGGLVVREALLNHAQTLQDITIPLFISIATPWQGHAAAQLGVDYAPAPVYSWRDMAPGSPFLSQLYRDGRTGQRRHLPPGLDHHLLFTFLPTESGDGTIALSSQLRAEAQEEAKRLHGFEQSHDGVLSDPKAVALIQHLLEAYRTAPGHRE